MDLESLKEDLREERRLKFGCDYCWTFKYGKLRVLTDEIWFDTIKEFAKKHNVKIDEWFIYDERKKVNDFL